MARQPHLDYDILAAGQDRRRFDEDRATLATVLLTRWMVDRDDMGRAELLHTGTEAMHLLGWSGSPAYAVAQAERLLQTPMYQHRWAELVEWHHHAVQAGGCPRCCGLRRDPTAPHRVYLVRYHNLHLFKVGVTTCSSDRRLETHRAAGALIIETLRVPSYPEALSVERAVLAAVRPWLRHHPLVAGGGEAWSDKAPPINLAAFANP